MPSNAVFRNTAEVTDQNGTYSIAHETLQYRPAVFLFGTDAPLPTGQGGPSASPRTYRLAPGAGAQSANPAVPGGKNSEHYDTNADFQVSGKYTRPSRSSQPEIVHLIGGHEHTATAYPNQG